MAHRKTVLQQEGKRYDNWSQWKDRTGDGQTEEDMYVCFIIMLSHVSLLIFPIGSGTHAPIPFGVSVDTVSQKRLRP